jgi:hypothetical protein
MNESHWPTNQVNLVSPNMTSVRNLVIEFIRDRINTNSYDRDKNPSWLFERLQTERVNSGEPDHDLEQNMDHVTHSLLNVAREFEGFVDDKYNGRFTELTEPLIPKLKNGSKQKYYDAFTTVADELFSHGISWSYIVTFLVYSAELTKRILELPSQADKDKTYKMVSQVISCVCRYFDENLMQWIKEQDGGWMSVVEYERTAKNTTSSKGDSISGKTVRQYIGMAAIAAIIGGLVGWLRRY